MKFKLNFSAIFAVMLAVTTINVNAAVLRIAGSTTVQKTLIEPITSKAREAGFEIQMLGVGTGKGLQLLFTDKVTVAAISDELNNAIADAKQSGATSIPGNLKMQTVIIDKMVPIVHPDNTVANLSKEQLKSIFNGKISNWKEVGGADMPIVVVISYTGSATRGIIEKQILEETKFVRDAKVLPTTAAEINAVAREKGGIGILGSGIAESAKGKVREVQGTNISRPLGFVTIGEPTAEVRKFYDFLQTPEAKKLFIQ